MRIGIDISQIVYSGTGVANYTTNLVKELIQINEAFFVLFGSSMRRRSDLEEFIKSFNKNNLTTKFLSFPPSFLDIIWNRLHFLNVEKFIGAVDIFHSSDWLQPPSKAKKITTIHDLVVFRYPQSLHPKILEVHKRRLKWVVKECDAIITDSESSKKDIEQYLNIDPQKINVVYLGIDPLFYPKKENEIEMVKKKYKLPNKYILSVGTNDPRKNLARVIKTYQRIKKDFSEDLVIVGNKGWGNEIKDFDRIHALGLINVYDLPALYSGASCLLYPSLYEGFGLPILEAMACGCPVICANYGSQKEISNGASLLVDPNNLEEITNAVTKILSSSTKDRQNYIIKGKDVAQKFSWKKTANETFAVYKKLI